VSPRGGSHTPGCEREAKEEEGEREKEEEHGDAEWDCMAWLCQDTPSEVEESNDEDRFEDHLRRRVHVNVLFEAAGMPSNAPKRSAHQTPAYKP